MLHHNETVHKHEMLLIITLNEKIQIEKVYIHPLMTRINALTHYVITGYSYCIITLCSTFGNSIAV